MEQNNGNVGEIVPQKKKRGRPRKSDQPIGGSTEKRKNKGEIKKNALESNSSKNELKMKKSMNVMSSNLAVVEEGKELEEKRPFVGHSVHGVVDGCFDSGYLVTIRVRDTNIVYRGVVFGPGISVPVENNRDMANIKDGLRVIKDEEDEEDLAREDGLISEEQHAIGNEDEEDGEGERDGEGEEDGEGEGEEEGEGEGEEALESQPVEEPSDFRVYHNLLQAQLQTQRQRQMIAQTTQVPFQTPSGSAFKPLASSAVLSSMGSGSTTMFATAKANAYANANPNAHAYAYAYAYANAMGHANASGNANANAIGHANNHAYTVSLNANAAGHANAYANARANVNANANANANTNLSASNFAPETAFRAPPFDQDMLRFMYPGGLPEPQLHPNHPIISNPGSINSGMYRQAPYPMPSSSSTLTQQYNTSPDVSLDPHPHPASNS